MQAQVPDVRGHVDLYVCHCVCFTKHVLAPRPCVIIRTLLKTGDQLSYKSLQLFYQCFDLIAETVGSFFNSNVFLMLCIVMFHKGKLVVFFTLAAGSHMLVVVLCMYLLDSHFVWFGHQKTQLSIFFIISLQLYIWLMIF